MDRKDAEDQDRPQGDLIGFKKYFSHDIVSGFLVFLIALPLCLGISLASGYPAVSGVFSAIIGGILAGVFSNSELTIKGPAAGLIVIAIGCIQDFGGNGMLGGWSESDMLAYRAALAVGCVAAVLQILFGLFRAGIVGEFFPISAVHGMLAAIGVIIIAKQMPVALGVSASGEPITMLLSIPKYILEANPAIAGIGVTSIAIMFMWPIFRTKFSLIARVPAPMMVLLIAIPMGLYFDLIHSHSYLLSGHQYKLSDQYLVAMPDQIFAVFSAISIPDFSILGEGKAWKWIFMFFIIGSLESLLSAKAIDLLDPWKRKTNIDKDIVAVGAINLLVSCIGGLPVISEIVRSKANIDNGARTRFANMWHGIFLLLSVSLIPMILHRIPLAALAAMLVYTGYRLAHPTEFLHIYKTGKEQLFIFLVTLVGVLATDLLIGIAIGIGFKFVIHLVNGVSVRSLFRSYIDISMKDEKTKIIHAHESAVFSNWISLRKVIYKIALDEGLNVCIDFSDTTLVDHSVMEHLYEVQEELGQKGISFEIVGFERHKLLADHEFAARKRVLGSV